MLYCRKRLLITVEFIYFVGFYKKDLSNLSSDSVHVCDKDKWLNKWISLVSNMWVKAKQRAFFLKISMGTEHDVSVTCVSVLTRNTALLDDYAAASYDPYLRFL